MNLLSFELSSETMLYLGSVAAASLVVTGAALAVVGVWRSAALPLRHAVLVGALAIAVASPLVLGAMWLSGIAAFEFSLEPVSPNASVELPNAKAVVQASQPSISVAVDDAAIQETNLAARSAHVPPTNSLATLDELSTLRAKEAWSWQDVAQVVVAVWAVGSLASLGALLAGLVRVRRLRLCCRQVALPRVTRLAAEAARNLGMAVVPEVYESALVDAPLSVGIWRSLVIVPENAVDSLADEQLRGLLLHELAHIARRDHLVGILQRAALVLYWWNPLVRRASGRIATLREEICDDLATLREPTGDGYAAMLVELASRAVSRRSLPTAIGMFDGSRSEFRRRVERLLEDGRLRVTALDRRMKLVSGAVCLSLLAVACLTSVQLQADGAESQEAVPAEEETPEVKWPKVLRGTVRDEQGKPVAGAKVRLDLEKIHEFKIGRWDETLSSQEMLTGPDGEYRFDATKYPEMKHRPFSLMMSVTADGYADAKAWNWYTRRDTKLDEKWLDVQMWKGRVVRGRVTTSYGEPVAGAVIKAAGNFGMNSSTYNWAWSPRKTDEDGKFSISVPERDAPVELWVVSRKWAPQRVVLPKRGNEIADVRLQPGARVTGRVTLEDGSPVVGAVVAAESIDDGTLNGMTFPVRLAAKTDDDGRYELPPLLGIYKLYLTQALDSDDRLLGRFIVANGPPPLTLPQRVAVVSGETQSVDFHGGEGLTVSGTVRWADGRPVTDCEAEATYLAPGNGTGITLDTTHTDAEGRYTIRLPKPIDHVSINVIGAYDAKRVWHYAKPTDDAPVERKQVQFANLKPLSEDLSGVDWVLMRQEDIPELQTAAEVKDPAADELAKLQRRYELRQQELQEALGQAKTFDERAELHLTRDPRVLMADEYLTFEEEHRDTDVGLAALLKLDQMAASVSNLMPKLPAARLELYKRLGEHYLQHPDLDLAFRSLSAGPQSSAGPELAMQAIESSPHASVKAGAIYQLACLCADQADEAAMIPSMIDEAKSQLPRDEVRLLMLVKAAAKLELAGFDPTSSREKALELARRLETEFADVREPERTFSMSGVFWRRPDGSDQGGKPTYGALAQGLIFDLEKLQIGLPAPDIVTEKDGMKSYATQYLGKVTVIMFDYSHNEAQKRSIADWAKSQAEKPLDVLVVRGRFEGEPNEVDGNALAPLRFVKEDHFGPIATQWSIRRRPTVFVVDGNGVIRARRQNDVPYHLVSELLKGAAAETDRVFEDKLPLRP